METASTEVPTYTMSCAYLGEECNGKSKSNCASGTYAYELHTLVTYRRRSYSQMDPGRVTSRPLSAVFWINAKAAEKMIILKKPKIFQNWRRV